MKVRTEATTRPGGGETTAPAVRTFRYDGLVVRVESSDSSHLAWLEEFLRPQFEITEGAPDCRVTLTADTARYEEALRDWLECRDGSTALPGDGEVDAFTLDNSVVRLPAARFAEGEIALHEADLRVLYTAHRERGEFRLVTPGKNLEMRTRLMRVVRELAMNHCQAADGLFVHSSAFVADGEAIMLVGPKNSGKTTLLIHALREGSARFLANDRVLVSFAGERALLRGMPTIVTVRPRTLDLFPDVRERLLAGSYIHRLSLLEVRSNPARRTRPWSDGRFGLSPAQLCEILGVESVATAPAGALCLVSVTEEPGGIDLTPLPSEEAAGRLRETLFGSRSWKRSSEVFAPRDARAYPDQAELDELCRKLTSRVRCYECRLGLDAYASPGSARAFVRALTG